MRKIDSARWHQLASRGQSWHLSPGWSPSRAWAPEPDEQKSPGSLLPLGGASTLTSSNLPPIGLSSLAYFFSFLFSVFVSSFVSLVSIRWLLCLTLLLKTYPQKSLILCGPAQRPVVSPHPFWLFVVSGTFSFNVFLLWVPWHLRLLVLLLAFITASLWLTGWFILPC